MKHSSSHLFYIYPTKSTLVYSIIRTNGYHNRATLIGIVPHLNCDTIIQELLSARISRVSLNILLNYQSKVLLMIQCIGIN